MPPQRREPVRSQTSHRGCPTSAGKKRLERGLRRRLAVAKRRRRRTGARTSEWSGSRFGRSRQTLPEAAKRLRASCASVPTYCLPSHGSYDRGPETSRLRPARANRVVSPAECSERPGDRSVRPTVVEPRHRRSVRVNATAPIAPRGSGLQRPIEVPTVWPASGSGFDLAPPHAANTTRSDRAAGSRLPGPTGWRPTDP